jgi:hypothetical protein
LEPFETSVPFATLPSYQNRGPANDGRRRQTGTYRAGLGHADGGAQLVGAVGALP